MASPLEKELAACTSAVKNAGGTTGEGHCAGNGWQPALMTKLIHTHARQLGRHLRVLEIGFNAGHSAIVFLHSERVSEMTSFDLGQHTSVAHAKAHVDKLYPGKHTLLLGDSRTTVPEHAGTYDLIFIDGGHDYPTAKADIENCRMRAHAKTLVIMDDVARRISPRPWHAGPTRAWGEAEAAGLLVELGSHEGEGTGMCWGYYTGKRASG